MHNKNGFSIIEAVVLMAVVVIVGTLGYMAYNNFVANKDSGAASTTDTASKSISTSPVVIKSNSDLNSIANELDSMSLEDSSSSSQFDTAASSF
ncbi:MAG: hypothetical protein H6797_03765 [Candidatus Nomurabacteria bacterium]|nr:MAG: hypothetical protein H6797_03765 [Candidatus Nomurabacteria bacterium]